MLLISSLENGDITAITTTSSRTRLLQTFPKSSLKWRTANWRTFNRKLFCFCDTRAHWHSLPFTLPGTSHRSFATTETKLSMLLKILQNSYFNDIRDADSRQGRSLTNSWWHNSFCTKLTLPCIFDRVPSWYNSLSTRHQICNYGAIVYTICSPRVKFRTVLNSICDNDSIVQHADPRLGEKVSLREQRMTHKILHTSHCHLHFLMTDCNPIERHNKDEMQLWRTPHH